MSSEDGIREFWRWWQSARERIVRAIEVERKFGDDLVEDISRHVDAIGELDWELAPGKAATHAFCLSPKGSPELRLITELWRHLGPKPDDTWEYYASRQPSEIMQIVFGGVPLDRSALVVAFEVDRDRERVDARYYHPEFDQLAEKARPLALYVLLDNAFGEDGVERWLGHIEAVATSPDGGRPFDVFAAAVAELQRTASGERFAILRGQTDTGAPVFVTINQALKRIDHLLCTMHVAIDLAILDQNEHGLTTSAEAERLNGIEDELAGELRSAAAYFGRETRPGHRILHWYAPEDGPAQSIIERWAGRHAEREPRIAWLRDPTWELVKRFA